MTAGTLELKPTEACDTAGAPLRILLASWAPFHAGAEVAAERLAIGLRDQGHEITVLLGTQGVTLERMKSLGLEVRQIDLALTDKWRWWRFARAQRQLHRLLVELRPDIVHANDLPTSQMVGRAAARLGIPRVCHHRWIFVGPALEWLNKFGAEHHIFVSQSIRYEMCITSPKLSQCSASVVHDCVRTPALPNEKLRARARELLGVRVDRKIVLFAGQIIERKGVHDLLVAWTKLSSTTQERTTLVIVGDDLESVGCYRRKMESLAARLRVRAEFQGFREDISDWIDAADICVVPSHHEPFGLSVLEGMAHGRPVIGSRVGGIPDMIVDGETGLLVPPRNPERLAAAIERLLSDDALCLKMGQKARKASEANFSVERHVTAIVREYRHVLAAVPRVTA